MVAPISWFVEGNLGLDDLDSDERRILGNMESEVEALNNGNIEAVTHRTTSSCEHQ